MKTRIVHKLAAVSRRDRSEMARDLAKSIAFENRGKRETAQAWGGALVRKLLALKLVKSE